MGTNSNTSALAILLTNNATRPLALIKGEIKGSSSTPVIDFPKVIPGGSTDGGFGAKASTTPYQVSFTYSPDDGETLLTFECDLSGRSGITIIPSKKGPEANNWFLSESPRLEGGVWVVQFFYRF